MVSDLIATPTVELLVQSRLPDAALEVYIDAADSRIIREVGPHDGVLVQYETFTGQGYFESGISLPYSLYGNSQNENIYFHRPAESVSEVKVWHYGNTEANGTVLEAAQYRTENSGRVLVRVNAWWEKHVKITYAPVAENPQRKQALVQLVKLALTFDGNKTSRVGSVMNSPADYAKEERRILNALRQTYAGAGLFA